MGSVTSAASPEQSRRARRHTEPDPTALPVLVLPATVLFAGVVAVAASVGYALSVVAFAVLALALAAGWASLLGAATPAGIRPALVVGAGLVAGALALTDGSQRLRWLPVIVAAGVIGAFVQQLLRRGGRGRLTRGVSATSSGLATMASGAALVPLALRPLGGELVSVAMAALVAGALASLAARVPRLRRMTAFVVLGAGLAAALAVAAVVALPLAGAAVVGVLVAGLSAVVRRVLAALPERELVASQLSCAAASVLLPGVVVLAVAVLAGA